MTKQTNSRKKKEAIEAKCGNCGEKVNRNQKFCPGCGAEMDWSSVDDEPEEKPAKKPEREAQTKDNNYGTITSCCSKNSIGAPHQWLKYLYFL